MEKKTAIVVINNKQFHVEKILTKSNEERIDWFSSLVDEDCTIHDNELVMAFDTIEEFCNEYNCGGLRCQSDSLITIEYTEKYNGKYIDCTSQEYIDKAIEQGNADVAEFISRISLCKNLNDVHALVLKADDMTFGACSDIYEDLLDINFKSVLVSVQEQSGGGLCVSNTIEVYDGGNLLWTGQMNLTGADFVEKQDNANIYLARTSDKTEVKEKPKYDGEFVDHIADIWREGHRTILVELSGEKYVINGLFDNDDIIIDVYIADTMERVDRYFVIGAQSTSEDEAEFYAEHFVEKVVKDRHINECWYLSDKQFKFLKEA